MTASRDAYAECSIPVVARLLTLLDRNPHSPTYGCFHRDYWLYKTSDFPDAVRQFGVHTLALVYKHDFPGSPYRSRPRIRDWTVAALDFWAGLQHGDGSFDEFYPYERGWAGPTAFTTYTACEALTLLGDEVPGPVRERVTAAVVKAAGFIAAGQSEEDHLANHHAMAALAVWKAFELSGDESLRRGFERLWEVFLTYHDREEGWSREYDGPDPGYLSATVSFLAKIHKTNPDPDILGVLRQSVEFCAYFVYPNGLYGGSLGSRNTQHFYAHGFELLAGREPMAAAVAERSLMALQDGGLVPPGIMSDRYVFYRVPELLLAYLDYTPRTGTPPPLPCERDDFTQYYPKAGIYAAVRGPHYVIANLAKGGVVKIFDRHDGRLALADNGLAGRLSDGRLLTSQWISADYHIEADAEGWTVAGRMQVVPAHKTFSLLKNLVFRGALFVLGWNSRFCHFLKGRIRQILILDPKKGPARFSRRFRFGEDGVSLEDRMTVDATARFVALSAGGDEFVRFVPQSRFFQASELEDMGQELDGDAVQRLNREKTLTILTKVTANAHRREVA
ncbi:MAG: hypothetical protein QGD90_06975 [Candidatus Hydrogenedentes bacterium]|nr:hypothetical protein [Candidatus Hydrogenedentota bacterium]